MGRTPVLVVAGMVMAGGLLAGCESSRPYYTPARSYSAASASAGGYSQAPTYHTPQRTMPSSAMASAASSPSLPERTATPVEATTSLQLVNNTGSGNPNPTPMMTITLPAVKVMVPINGLYTYPGPTGATLSHIPTADATSAGLSATAIMPPLTQSMADSPMMRSSNANTAPTAGYSVGTMTPALPGSAFPSSAGASNAYPTTNMSYSRDPNGLNAGQATFGRSSAAYTNAAPGYGGSGTGYPTGGSGYSNAVLAGRSATSYGDSMGNGLSNTAYSTTTNSPGVSTAGYTTANNPGMMSSVNNAVLSVNSPDDSMSRMRSMGMNPLNSVPPPPSWPRSSGSGEDNSMNEPPPPPPVRRNPGLYSTSPAPVTNAGGY